MIEINSIALENSIKVLLLLLFLSIIFIFIFLYFNKYLAFFFKYIVPKKYHQAVSKINIDFRQGLKLMFIKALKPFFQIIKNLCLRVFFLNTCYIIVY